MYIYILKKTVYIEREKEKERDWDTPRMNIFAGMIVPFDFGRVASWVNPQIPTIQQGSAGYFAGNPT